MKKEITLGQLLGVGLSLLVTVVTGWITLNNKVSSNEVEIRQLKANQEYMQNKWDRGMERLQDKIEEGNVDIRKILVELQNKADRPK
jgi:hypothetical protein